MDRCRYCGGPTSDHGPLHTQPCGIAYERGYQLGKRTYSSDRTHILASMASRIAAGLVVDDDPGLGPDKWPEWVERTSVDIAKRILARIEAEGQEGGDGE